MTAQDLGGLLGRLSVLDVSEITVIPGQTAHHQGVAVHLADLPAHIHALDIGFHIVLGGGEGDNRRGRQRQQEDQNQAESQEDAGSQLQAGE